jgi:hypothetical protein
LNLVLAGMVVISVGCRAALGYRSVGRAAPGTHSLTDIHPISDPADWLSASLATMFARDEAGSLLKRIGVINRQYEIIHIDGTSFIFFAEVLP